MDMDIHCAITPTSNIYKWLLHFVVSPVSIYYSVAAIMRPVAVRHEMHHTLVSEAIIMHILLHH